jgi:hypothetical protein
MNHKNALFLSASLTAFVLAVLFGVVTKVYGSNTQAANAAPVAPAVQAVVVQNTAVATLEQPTDMPVATVEAPLTPEAAVELAVAAINRQDVYSVETSTYQGVESYKVVFSSGDIVYIGLDKQVLAKTKLQVAVVSPTQAATKRVKSTGGGGVTTNSQPSSNSSGGGEHEGGDDHEGGGEGEHD